MAQKREVEQWITVNGRHIPVFKGESKEDAVKRMVGKESAPKKESKQESKDTDNVQETKAAPEKQSGSTKSPEFKSYQEAEAYYKDKFANVSSTYANKLAAKLGIEGRGKEKRDAIAKVMAEKWKTSNDISNNEDLKEKQIAQHKQEADRLNGKKVSNSGSTAKQDYAAAAAGKFEDLHTQYWNAKGDLSKNKIKEQIRKTADALPDGTVLARVKQDTSSTYTSKGVVQSTDTKISKLYKINGQWSRYKDGSGKIDDMASEIIHNSGKLQTLEEAEKQAAKLRETDEIKSKYYGKNEKFEKPESTYSGVVKDTPELRKSLKSFEDDELWGGRGRLDSYSNLGNTNPNKMDPKDSTTEKGYQVYLEPKASRDKNTLNKLKELGFKQVDDRRWKLVTEKSGDEGSKAKVSEPQPKKVTPISRQEFEKLSMTEKRSYSADIADQSYREALEEVGLTQDNAHLMTEQQFDKFGRILESKIYKANADLSFQQKTMTKMGVGISGNATGIASSYRFGDQAPINRAWEEVKMTPNEIREHLKKHKNAGVYEEARYGGVKQGNIERLLATKLGSSYSNHGIGSQASTTQLVVKLYKDKKGNLKLSKHALTWD